MLPCKRRKVSAIRTGGSDLGLTGRGSDVRRKDRLTVSLGTAAPDAYRSSPRPRRIGTVPVEEGGRKGMRRGEDARMGKGSCRVEEERKARKESCLSIPLDTCPSWPCAAAVWTPPDQTADEVFKQPGSGLVFEVEQRKTREERWTRRWQSQERKVRRREVGRPYGDPELPLHTPPSPSSDHNSPSRVPPVTTSRTTEQ